MTATSTTRLRRQRPSGSRHRMERSAARAGLRVLGSPGSRPPKSCCPRPCAWPRPTRASAATSASTPPARPPTRIVMDAPPDKEDSAPFVQVAQLMAEAGLHAPQVLDWDAGQRLPAAGRPGHADHARRDRPGQPAGQRGPVRRRPSTRWCAGSWRRSPACCRPTTRRCCAASWPSFPTGTSRSTAASPVEGKLAETLDAMLRADRRTQPGRAAVYVHRDFMPRNLMVQPDTDRAGRARFPGRGVRPDHLRHRLPDARRLPQLGRGVRARRHRALLAEGAQGRPAGGRATSASSTAPSNGWACSATSRWPASSRGSPCATASPATWPTRRASSATSAPPPAATASWRRCCGSSTRSKAREPARGYAFGRV